MEFAFTTSCSFFFNISKRIVATTWEPDEAEIVDNRVAEQLRFSVRLPEPVTVPAAANGPPITSRIVNALSAMVRSASARD